MLSYRNGSFEIVIKTVLFENLRRENFHIIGR